jgi:glyoxylate/hydroxypyruvate reductase A
MEVTKLRFVIIAPKAEVTKWQGAFAVVAPEIHLEEGPEVAQPETVDVLLLWNHPQGSLTPFVNAKLFYSLGAGVDHLMQDALLPKHVPICRIVDPLLSFSMSNYILFAVLHYHRKWSKYIHDKKHRIWDHDSFPEQAVKIGVLGLGTLGQDAAKKLQYMGFEVVGYSPSKKELPGITTYAEGELNTFLAGINVLVCTVPYTPQTHGLLSQSLFQQLQQPTCLINVARGKVQVEADIIQALDAGILDWAFLDVFETEPLPKESPLWSHPKVEITPHIASVTNPQAGVQQMLKNLGFLLEGKSLLHQVNFSKGY